MSDGRIFFIRLLALLRSRPADPTRDSGVDATFVVGLVPSLDTAEGTLAAAAGAASCSSRGLGGNEDNAIGLFQVSQAWYL